MGVYKFVGVVSSDQTTYQLEHGRSEKETQSSPNNMQAAL